ncbi:MAG: response regulator [Desulfotignum sp.]|jgi:signal transduction histidine kinase|nr:response regulator [Desulfotignum sp.]
MQYEDKDFDLAQLKKKAAQIVGERQKEKFENKASDMARLIHELKIYQEEVELQNQELRQTAKSLENARNEWFALFDAAPVGFVIIDRLNTIERCNQAGARLLTGTRHPMSGRSILPRIHPDDRRKYYSLGESMAKHPGTTATCDLRLVQENAGIVHVHLEGSTVKGAEGKFDQFRVALVDISEQKAHEKSLKKIQEELEDRVEERTAELAARNRQLAKLTSELTLAEERERKRVAEILHENLQQLLAGARLHLEIHSEEVGGEDTAAWKTAYDLITKSIETSRTLSSELSPPVLYHKELPEALQWLARWMAATHQLDVDLALPNDFVFLREELKVLLFHSVRELLFNVVKHAQTSRAQVTMMEKNGQVRIMVSDKGRGCDAKNLTLNGSDTGFGLFAIRERVELLGGNLTIACAPDEGVTATIDLPVEPPVYAKPEEPSLVTEEFEKVTQPSSKPVSTGGKIRVMLVDDHAVMRQGLLSFLSGHDDIEIAAEAADGEAAVEQARQIQPDVILMDINMPKMNGVEACRRIQSEMPGIRIYGLSMYEAEDQAQAMAEAGAAGYLSKSGNSDSLLAAIREK